MRKITTFLLFFFSLQAFAISPEVVHGQKGMVASRSMIASTVGRDILKSGGNAIDAAVAVGFALAVTYPSAGNLGGGGFMMIHLKNGDVLSLDFREVAPLAATRDMYLDAQGNVIKGASTHSHKAVGVPGTVAGLLEVLEKYGSQSRQQVIAPAIKLAREGFPLSYDLARQFKYYSPRLSQYPASKKIFTQQGKPYKEGDIWRQADLADSLQRIADHGREGFYKGKTADLLVAEMQRGGGLISHQDLVEYQPKWRKAIKGQYRGYTIWSMPPPSSGGALLVQMLNMLEPYDVAAMGWGSAASIHLMVEAERRAYADRAEYLGDPDFVDVPVEMLTSKRYAKERFKNFQPNKASDSNAIGFGHWPEESQDTTHYSIIDQDGNAVSTTTTLNLGYGSKIVVTGAGFLLNNEMDDFSVKPGVPNAYGLLGNTANNVQAKKRMLSSMTPTIVAKNNKPYLITGSPGGSTIINTVFQVVVNTIDHNMSLSNAVGLPRIHHQWKPDRIQYEAYSLSPDTKKILEAMGHKNLVPTRWPLGDANSIRVVGEEFHGMSDPRNDGGASGF